MSLEPSFAARDYDPRDPPHFGEWVRVEGIELSAAPGAAPETAATEATETVATPEPPARQDEAAAPVDRNDLADLLTGSSDAWRVAPPMSTKATGEDAVATLPGALPDEAGGGGARPEQRQERLMLALMLVVIVLAALLLYLGFGGPGPQPEPPAPSPTVSPTVQPTLGPTLQPTSAPTLAPTASPTAAPTLAPTAQGTNR